MALFLVFLQFQVSPSLPPVHPFFSSHLDATTAPKQHILFQETGTSQRNYEDILA